jgi:hypothetical protein
MPVTDALTVHACSACGGSGADPKQPINWTLSRFVEHEDGTLSEVPGEQYMNPCPVCLGNGGLREAK